MLTHKIKTFDEIEGKITYELHYKTDEKEVKCIFTYKPKENYVWLKFSIFYTDHEWFETTETIDNINSLKQAKDLLKFIVKLIKIRAYSIRYISGLIPDSLKDNIKRPEIVKFVLDFTFARALLGRNSGYELNHKYSLIQLSIDNYSFQYTWSKKDNSYSCKLSLVSNIEDDDARIYITQKYKLLSVKGADTRLFVNPDGLDIEFENINGKSGLISIPRMDYEYDWQMNRDSIILLYPLITKNKDFIIETK